MSFQKEEEVFSKAKDRLLSGQATLRQLSREFGIDRETLMSFILKVCSEDEIKQLNNVLSENKASASIEIDDSLKNIIIRILKGEITAKQASEEYGIDRETLRRKADELANSSPEYIKYYIRYKSQRGDYSGINFRRLFIDLIEKNMTQTEMAQQYGIPVRTVSRELEKIGQSEDEQDQRLYDIAKIYAEKQMRREKLTELEERLYARILSEIKENTKFVSIDYENAKSKRLRQLQEFKCQVQALTSEGKTKKQIAKELGVGISTIRRRLLELDELMRLEDKKMKPSNPSDPDEPDGRE